MSGELILFEDFPVDEVAEWAGTQTEGDEKQWKGSKYRYLQKENMKKDLLEKISASLKTVRKLYEFKKSDAELRKGKVMGDHSNSRSKHWHNTYRIRHHSDCS